MAKGVGEGPGNHLKGQTPGDRIGQAYCCSRSAGGQVGPFPAHQERRG